MDQYTFTVPTKGLCVMCLTDNNAKSPTKMEEVSIQSIHSYLRLDYRKIFNITAPTIFHENYADPEREKDLVDIKVTLCKSCSDLRNKFCDLYAEMEEKRQRLNSCVQSMLEVMINAESNVIRSRRYKQTITGVEPGSLPTSSSSVVELIKTSIPDKFRKETMHKCVSQVEKTKVKDEVSPIVTINSKKIPVPIEHELELEPLIDDNVYDDWMNGDGFEEQNEAADNLSDEEDDAMKVDEDADPEELMMRYNSYPESYKRSPKADSSKNAASGFSNPTQGNVWDDAEGLEFEDEQPTAAGPGQEADNKGTFNSRFKCKTCGKVVVSLKNFELHQRRHTGEKPFPCPFCDQHFRDTSNLRSHTLRYHRQFLFANFKDASVTEEEFKVGLDKIVQSIVQVSEGFGVSHQSHRCYLCNKDYTQKYAIEDHIVQRHYDVVSTATLHLQKEILSYDSSDIADYMAQIQESGETCTICGLCGQQFRTGIEVNNHMKVHVKVKVTRSKGTVQKSDTSNSLIQLKMKCNFCSKYFEDLNALTMHKTLHQGNCASAASRETFYNCEHCGRTFCSFYSQRSHVLTFHRHQVFKRYLPPGTSPAEIEAIIKGITGKYKKLPNGLFQCSLCMKEITQLRKLQSHMLVTHFDEVVMKLKAALHQKRLQNEEGDGEPPELDYYEDSNGSPGGNIPLNGDYDNVGNIAIVALNEDVAACENLQALISRPPE